MWLASKRGGNDTDRVDGLDQVLKDMAQCKTSNVDPQMKAVGVVLRTFRAFVARVHSDEVADQVPLAARPPVEFPAPGLNNKVLKVNFNFWSHRPSGLQRAYLHCPYHVGEKCIKYRFVHVHDNHKACVAWMLAWAEMGHLICGNKRDHLAEDPDPEVVEAYYDLL